MGKNAISKQFNESQRPQRYNPPSPVLKKDPLAMEIDSIKRGLGLDISIIIFYNIIMFFNIC
jgi:hypothetical protein